LIERRIDNQLVAKGSSLSLNTKKGRCGGTMRDPMAVLKSLTEKSQDKMYKFQRLYRNLYNPDFYWLAYKNIYASKGSMTPGVDGTTIDGMSDRRIGKIIASLKDHSYQPNPARREYIAKKNNPDKKRPLGITSANDKLIQEVVRMILESIFEPNFSNQAHGFRPYKSCHTALIQIQDTFTGVHWFVEGDIEACFDSFDHHVVINLLRQRIEDEPFISLMWKFLKAGYMEQWEYNKTYDGVPQGSGISPILSNIYLSELDMFMENYKIDFDLGKTRRTNPEYSKIGSRIRTVRGRIERKRDCLSDDDIEKLNVEIKTLQDNRRKIYSRMPQDTSYKRIQYVRYADDFIIGVTGSKEDAEQVKADVREFLAEKLRLKLSDGKTKITHSGDTARFLGYDILVSRDQSVKRRSDGVKQRTNSYTVKLLVPREKWVSKLQEYKAFRIQKYADGKERFKVLHRGRLINKPDIEILSAYNSEIRGLYNFYRIANNAYAVGRFAGVMEYSMHKTFANKYRTKVSKIKAHYEKDGVFTVEYHTKKGMKNATFYNGGFKRKEEAIRDANVSTLPPYKKYDKINSLASRIRAGACELCGSKTENLMFHQVKKLNDLKGTHEWERKMIRIRRKTLVVCFDCHNTIHT